jgi:hypothetical protein
MVAVKVNDKWVGFRSGQRVKFKDVIGLSEVELLSLRAIGHRTADECFVGTYVREGQDGLGAWAPTRILPMSATGTNILSMVGGTNIALNPAACIDLHPVTEREEMPAAWLANADPNWIPAP